MDSLEIKKEFAMSYQELVGYLLKKYGAAQYDYFVNESCKSKNKKAMRTSEGLFCHHIDEDKAIMLSHDEWATKNPFSYQNGQARVLQFLGTLHATYQDRRRASLPRGE